MLPCQNASVRLLNRRASGVSRGAEMPAPAETRCHTRPCPSVLSTQSSVLSPQPSTLVLPPVGIRRHTTARLLEDLWTLAACWLVIGLLLAALATGGCMSAGGGLGGGAGAPDTDGGGDTDEPEPPEDNATLREIEEADIVKEQGGYFYLANRYRGLRIIDATAIERPVMAGGVDLQGRGVELYVDDDRAFVVTSADFFACAGEPVSYEDAVVADSFLWPDYGGSRITVADVTDPTAPFEITHFDMDGFITATRRVGDIIYAAGNLDESSTAADSDDDVATDGPTDADGGDDADDGPAPVTGPAATVAEDGSATATVTSTEGIQAELHVTGAAPGAFVQLTVADRDTHPDSPGVPDDLVLPLTVTVASDLADGEFTGNLTVEFDPALLETLGVSLPITAVYRHDDDLGLWLAAATIDAGSSYPTGHLGEYGFFSIESDDACVTNGDCASDEYCNLPACDAEVGTCAARPAGCPEQGGRVCGCDGQEYWNTCDAARDGVSIDFEGPCADGPPDDVEPPDTEVGVNYVVWAVVDRLGDYTVGRSFDRDLTVTLGDMSGGTAAVDPQADAYDYGEVVTLTAQPDDGFHFVQWTFDPPRPDVPNTEVVEVTLVGDLQVTAKFEADTGGDTGPRVFVVSIDISDPANIRQVDSLTIAGESLDIHVTPNAMYVLGDDPTMSDTTRVIYVDISDPAGDVVERDTFRVPGLVGSRFFADEHDGVFRIITDEFSEAAWEPVVALYNYDVGDPDEIDRIGRLVIETGESLRSVRFDGDRGYAVTFRQVDPLFVLDLADPQAPLVAGELEVPGWSTHLVPLGDRLVGVGFDDRAGFRPAVALYDVSQPDHPRQLARILLGERWTFDTTSEATVDEKALKVLEDEELILIPVSSYDRDRAEYVDSLQLIDLLPGDLDERGMIEHRGLVRRAGVTDTRLWLLSDESFQVADMDDRDAPARIDTVDVMSEQDLLDAGLADCADSARYHGFVLGDFWMWPMGDLVFMHGPVRGPCGAMGMMGMWLTAASMLFLSAVRRRRMCGTGFQPVAKQVLSPES